MTQQTFDLIREISDALANNASTVRLPVSRAIYGELGATSLSPFAFDAQQVATLKSTDHQIVEIGRSPNGSLRHSCFAFLDHLLTRLATD
jgi:hypothetical protein